MQGPNEAFADFVARVQKSVEFRVTHAAAAEALMKELIHEGATGECRQLINGTHSNDLEDWIMVCKDVETSAHQAETLAEALARQPEPKRRRNGSARAKRENLFCLWGNRARLR